MTPSLSNRLAALARDRTLADGTPCRIVGVAEIQRLARERGVNAKTLEIAALKQSILPDRYLRNRKSLSIGEQIRLLESSVCIVGLGGLGGLVSETAARLGVGRLSLVDGDVFEAHNLNRQLMSRTDRLGTRKVDAAATRIAVVDPGITVTTEPAYLTATNADKLLGASHDLVVDCLDNIRSRFDLETGAKRAGLPVVSAAIAGLCGHVTTIFPQDKGLESIYGPADSAMTATGAELSLGCLAPAVNVMASLASAEMLKVLLGRDHNLRNRLLAVDLNDYTMQLLRLG